MEKAEKKSVPGIFLMFLKFGCFTFGGGWGIVAQMQREYVEKRQWLTNEELLDFTSVGRSIPGLMISNTSVLFGYCMAGPLGALAALLGMVIPPFAVMMGVVYCYELMRENLYVSYAMMGVRAAVVPIIICALGKMFHTAMKDWLCYLIAICALMLGFFTGMSNVLIVLLGAVAGIAAMEVKSRNDLH